MSAVRTRGEVGRAASGKMVLSAFIRRACVLSFSFSLVCVIRVFTSAMHACVCVVKTEPFIWSVSKPTWCLTSTETVRLIRDGEKKGRGYEGGDIIYIYRYTVTTGIYHHHHRFPTLTCTPYLCSIGAGAGSLSPGNDTLKLHDRGGGGDDDHDEIADGQANSDKLIQPVKYPWIFLIQPRGHHFVHRVVGLRLNHCLDFQLPRIQRLWSLLIDIWLTELGFK